MYNYGNSYYAYETSSSVSGVAIWLIISAVIAIIGGIVVYFIFLSKKNEGKFTGFVGYLYDFLTFKKMWLETLLKITYLILAIYVTLQSFAFIGSNFLLFLGSLVIGNLLLRITYEFSLVLLTICRNTTEINSKLSKQKTNKKEKED